MHPVRSAQHRRLTVCAPAALKPVGSGKMASRHKHLKRYMKAILEENGPMTSHQMIDALHERRERLNSPKSIPGVNQVAMVLRKHKEFTSTGQVKQASELSGGYAVQVWYLKGEEHESEN